LYPIYCLARILPPMMIPISQPSMVASVIKSSGALVTNPRGGYMLYMQISALRVGELFSSV
jgi:hypothetical protein